MRGPWFVAFAETHGINSPTTAGFRLLSAELEGDTACPLDRGNGSRLCDCNWTRGTVSHPGLSEKLVLVQVLWIGKMSFVE